MNRQIVIAVSLSFSLGLGSIAKADEPTATPDQDVKTPLLNGTWVVQAMEQVGMKLEGDKLPEPMRGLKRVFDKQQMIVKRLDREYKCTFTVDDSKTPKHMDVTVKSEGRAPRTMKCIYEIKQDTLRLAESKLDRPTSFKTDPTMRRVIVYTLKRQKKDD